MDDAFLLQSNMAMLGFETTAPPPILPNILDVNREKIVIRPRCKEYVQKQRTVPTLSCFSATIHKEKIPAEEEPEPQLYVVLDDNALNAAKVPSALTKLGAAKKVAVATKKVKPTKLAVAKKVTPTKPRNSPPTEPRAFKSEAMFKPRVVASGRIEKASRSPPRSPPRTVQPLDVPTDAPAVVAAVAPREYKLYSCGCSSPADCLRCTMWRLTDRFCAIVTERKERIRQREMSPTCS
ncbi:hypothetical protein C8R46DRAFT_1052450 [Mycena filopes]|nr:hypothetical protein C8R46DRAFT_1052450 [Mycena filopes]